MNILMISHEYPPIGGGGANACMNLAAQYIKKGHLVTVLTVYYEGLLEYEEKGNLRIIRLKARRKHKEHCGFAEMLDFMFRAIKAGDELVRKTRFDIAQVFFAIPAGPVGYYLRKRYGLKYVIRFGGGDIPGFQERFRFIYKILGPFEKAIWRGAFALVANSQGLRELALSFYDKKEVLVIPNGVDPEAFAPADLSGTEDSIDKDDSFNKDDSFSKNDNVISGAAIPVSNNPGISNNKKTPFRILFVSRLIERKGLQFIIPHIKEMAVSSPNGIHLTIVGDGPYRPVLEELTDRHNAREYIDFSGQRDKSELSRYYNNADLFILPSKKEGMPNVVLEAMSAGLPIIMTPCQGSHELIDGNGYVTQAEGFPEKILSLAKDPDYAKKLGIRSRELIMERFLWERTAQSYLAIFEKV